MFSEKTVHCTVLQMVPNERTPKNLVGSSFRFFKELLSLKNIKILKMTEYCMYITFYGKTVHWGCCKWCQMNERPKIHLGHLSDPCSIKKEKP